MECTATNELNIVVATAVNGYNLTGSWQLVIWGSNRQTYDADEADRCHETALSLDLKDIPIGSDLRTIQKEVRWYMDQGPSCDELGFLCVQLQPIDFSDFPSSTDPQPSCHKITSESKFLYDLINLFDTNTIIKCTVLFHIFSFVRMFVHLTNVLHLILMSRTTYFPIQGNFKIERRSNE